MLHERFQTHQLASERMRLLSQCSLDLFQRQWRRMKHERVHEAPVASAREARIRLLTPVRFYLNAPLTNLTPTIVSEAFPALAAGRHRPPSKGMRDGFRDTFGEDPGYA